MKFLINFTQKLEDFRLFELLSLCEYYNINIKYNKYKILNNLTKFE